MDVFESPKEIAEKNSESQNRVGFGCNIEDYPKCSKATFERRFTDEKIQETPIDNFIIHKTIGIGAFGYIRLVSHKSVESDFFAMKIIKKQLLLRKNHLKYALTEKRMLSVIRHPFIAHMAYYVNDPCYLCFVMPYAVGGNLLGLMRTAGILNEAHSKFYAGQIVLALEHLHSLGIIYRNLQPQNVLINEDGYITLTDFGLSKLVKNGRTATVCGTPQYFAPEIILSKSYGVSVDWWTLGVITYELTSGNVPFYDRSETRLYDKIIHGNYKIPDNFSPNLTDLIENLLQIDTTKRYGNLRDGVDDVKNHRWFNTVDWTLLLNKRMKAPFEPLNDISLAAVKRAGGKKSNSNTLRMVCDDIDRLAFADF